MKIKWGALVVDGRGKIGGHVASKNRGGAYLRTKVTPVNPQTADQSAVRQLFGQLSQAWSTLSDAERASFDEGVEAYQQTNIFGDLKSPSGKALFQRLNQNLLQVGGSQVNTLPALASAPSDYPTSAVIDVLNTVITLTPIDQNNGTKAIVRASGSVSQGTSFVKNKMRIIYAGVTDQGTVTNSIYSGYVSKFGTPQASDRIFLEFNYVLANGVQTPRVKLLASVTA